MKFAEKCSVSTRMYLSKLISKNRVDELITKYEHVIELLNWTTLTVHVWNITVFLLHNLSNNSSAYSENLKRYLYYIETYISYSLKYATKKERPLKN